MKDRNPKLNHRCHFHMKLRKFSKVNVKNNLEKYPITSQQSAVLYDTDFTDNDDPNERRIYKMIIRFTLIYQ